MKENSKKKAETSLKQQILMIWSFSCQCRVCARKLKIDTSVKLIKQTAVENFNSLDTTVHGLSPMKWIDIFNFRHFSSVCSKLESPKPNNSLVFKI